MDLYMAEFLLRQLAYEQLPTTGTDEMERGTHTRSRPGLLLRLSAAACQQHVEIKEKAGGIPEVAICRNMLMAGGWCRRKAPRTSKLCVSAVDAPPCDPGLKEVPPPGIESGSSA